MRRLSTLIFFTSACAFAFSQAELDYRHRAGFSFFRLESNAETINNRLEPKFVPGIYYEYLATRKTTAMMTIEYGSNNINDNCRNCADHLYGTGKMTEFNIVAGYKYIFNWRSQSPFKYFAQLDAFFGLLDYTGNFEGGWSGAGHAIDNSYRSVGGMLRGGFNYYITARIVITASGYLRLAHTEFKNNIIGITTKGGFAGYGPVELRFGFLF